MQIVLTKCFFFAAVVRLNRWSCLYETVST